MPSKLEKFIAKTGKRGMPDYKEAPGQVMLYSDEELEQLVERGLEKPHATLLNQIVKIRAMDAARMALEEKSDSARVKALAKVNPKAAEKLAALLKEFGV